MLGTMKRSLETLIRFSKPLKNFFNYSATNRRFISSCNIHATHFLHPSPWTLFGEYPRGIHYQVEKEADRGSDSNPLIVTTNDTKKGKEEQLTCLKKGDTVNLSDLLFTKTRDYLIKCDDGQRVHVDYLAGKVVVIYFYSVLHMDNYGLINLMRIYKDLQPNNGFEVVFVRVDDNFNSEMPESIDIISRMPWTTIPLSDTTSRKHLQQICNICENSYLVESIIVDSTGMILQCYAQRILYEYGALGYPFSDERINYLKFEDEAAARQPSLKTLLASPERDYLISNKEDKVPIHTLEDKVVALYFYEEGLTSEHVTDELKIAYQELAKNNRKFEVVLIYIVNPSNMDFNVEESFWKRFKTMPWLAVPFECSLVKKLHRIFYDPFDEWDGLEFSLTIIGPHMEFIEPHGVFILMTYKAPAYPFSLEKVAKLVTEEAKELRLEMLWDPNSVFGGKYESQVQFSQFAGKKVMIFFNWGQLNDPDNSFMYSLKRRYIEMKGTDDEFEVIHLSFKCWRVGNLPWFVHPLGKDCISRASSLFDLERYYDSNYLNGSAALIAFDQNGRVVRKTNFPELDNSEFPFNACGMEKETLDHLFTMLDRYRPQGKIYEYS